MPAPEPVDRWRNRLRSIGPLRNAYVLSRALVALARDTWSRPAEFDRVFARARDPWDYARPEERARHRAAFALLDAAGRERFPRALEVACAEGMFTELLATRCDALLAVDFSTVALARAIERLAGRTNVTFDARNLRADPLPGAFDLVVAMDVLSTIVRPAALAAVIDKLVRALAPSGHLLVTDVRQSTVFETAWWGKHLRRGGTRILDALAADPRLGVVRRDATATHVYALFERR